MGKRRGDDVLIASVPAVVADSSYTTSSNSTTSGFSTTSGHCSPAWIDSASSDHKLWVVRQSLKLDSFHNDAADTDDFLAEFSQCRAKQQTLRDKREAVKSASQQIQAKLMEQIEQEEANCQMESANMEALEKSLQEIARERDSIANDISDLKQMGDNLQHRIAKAIEEASQVVECIDLVEEARKNQVPRLKHQISLYANTTGIKWNFENDSVLEGHVSIPSKQVIRSFSIDPQECTTWEIANRLWSIMDASRED